MCLEVENLIKEINSHKEYFHFSMDIYYNDLDDTFVVKLHNIYPMFLGSDSFHFRQKKVIDSLLDAFNFIKSISKTQ